MLMRDVEIGQTAFLEERLDGETRETFYTRNAEATYLRHGCIQGDLPEDDGACPWESGREAYRPRFIRFSGEPFEYPLVGALPVKPISQSRFWQYRPRADR